MASQYSNLSTHDKKVLQLLEVQGNCFKRLYYRSIVKEAKNLYMAYVKKRNEYVEYIDFYTPLMWHLICMGFKERKIHNYLNIVRDRINEILSLQISKENHGKID